MDGCKCSSKIELFPWLNTVTFKDKLKAFDNFKNKQGSVWSKVVWYVKVCIFWKCIQYTIHYDKTQVLNAFSFFFHELQLITVLLLNYDCYMNWSISFVSLALCVGFFIFDSVSFLLKFIFLFNKIHGIFDFKTS